MSGSTVVLMQALAAVLAAATVYALIGWGLLAIVRHRRTPVELRGDWWTPFERELRAYAAAVSGAADGFGQRRPGADPPPSAAAS
jgi:hypothetical protein